MRTSAVIRIILLSLAILILGSILLGSLAFDQYRFNGNEYFERPDIPESPAAVIDQGEISAQIRNIAIEWVSGTITIQPDENVRSIHVTEYSSTGSDYETVMKQSGQTLKIKFCEESIKLSGFGINAEVSKDLIISVPVGWNCNELEIDAAATDVRIHNLQMNELDFDGASGKLILDNCDIVNLDVDTASGDVEFTGTLKDLDFDAASAKFRGEFFQMPNRLNLDAMSGDMDIILPEYCWFSCQLDTVSGRFDTDFATTKENDIYIHGSKENACHIKISALSGDVSILKGITSGTSFCNIDGCTDPSHEHGVNCTDPNCSDVTHNHSSHSDDYCEDTSHGHSNTTPVKNCDH